MTPEIQTDISLKRLGRIGLCMNKKSSTYLLVSEEEDEGEERNIRRDKKDPAAAIEEIFSCPICLGRIHDAQMCPSCSKVILFFDSLTYFGTDVLCRLY